MNRKNFKVLVVDDEAIMRDFLTDVLTDQGFSVEKESGGEEVEKILEKKEFSLILSDLRMPNCDGLQVLEIVRKMCPRTKVILMTGYALDNSGQEYLNRGAFGFILKPFDMDQIRNLILNAYETTEGERSQNDSLHPMNEPMS